MNNVNELRSELASLYKSVKSGKTPLPQAKALVGTANSILHSVQIELNQNKFIGNKTPITFMESGSKAKK